MSAAAEIAGGGLFGLSVPSGLVEAAGLVLARTTAMLLTTPLIGTGATFYGYKVALVVAVTVVMFAAQGVPLVHVDSWIAYAVLAIREMVIGLGLGFMLHLVVTAVRVGGEMIGNEMAFTMANVVDPASGESMPLLSRMYESLFFLALLAVDGHHWVLRALSESYERAPVGGMELGGDLTHAIVTVFAELFSAGVAFAAPVFVLLTMVSVVIGFIARAVPQVNILEMGFSLRVAGGLGAIGLLSPTIAPAMDGLLQRFMRGLEMGLDAL